MAATLRKILQPIYTIYLLVTFLAGMIVCFPFFFLFSLPNSKRGRRAIYTVIKYWAKSWLWAIGMPVQVRGVLPPDGRYIVVANHISYMDTIAIFVAIPFYFRALGKKEISRIPLLGYLYRQIVIMVDRDSDNSRARSMRMMQQSVTGEGSILIFPEGTFNETGAPLKDFYNGAFRLALSTGTPILPLVFADMEQRWDYRAWWKLWPGPNRAIFLPVITVADEGPNIDALKQRVYDAMEVELIKINKV
jgi:1-acyl-sn-glycerol-3-phosphate acyltransferase